jgi:transcriptional regulator with GAF, ATPase, and Fis domain
MRVLQEHTFEPLGGTQSVEANLRVTAATNRNLEEEVSSGNFPERSILSLERGPDSASAAPRSPFRLPNHGLRSTGFTEDAILKLQRYVFPGNVRELEHIIERAVVRGGGATDHL